MKLWSLSQIPDTEKNDILSKHREVYNGYQTMQPKVENTQPLYVQDFAKDKLGATMKNDGTIKPYTDYRINESHVMDTCEQCGGKLTERECSECGYKMEGPLDEFDLGSIFGKKENKDNKEKKDKKSYFSSTWWGHGDTDKEDGNTSTDSDTDTDTDTDWDIDIDLDESNFKKGKLSDIHNVEDLGDDDFDYVEGGGNDYGTFEKMHHMKKLKAEGIATSNAPLSYGKHYNEIEEPYDFVSNGPVGDGGTLRQKPVNEVGFTGGGNAPDFDIDYENPAFDFESDGPIEDTFTEPADDMDLDKKRVKKPYDFVSDGPETGDVYPVFEEMKSAWADDDIEELPDMETEKNRRSSLELPDMETEKNRRSSLELPDMGIENIKNDELDEVDISGVQGVYGDTEKPYAFVSSGPGKAGPYQTHSWGGEKLSGYEGENEDVYWELEKGELDPDKIDKEASWEEITAMTGDDEFSNLDEEVKEKLEMQREKIVEMFERLKRFN